MSKAKLVLEFPTPEIRASFLAWMCDAGGQDHFYDHCDVRGEPKMKFDFWDGTEQGKNYVGDSTADEVSVFTEVLPEEDVAGDGEL